MDIQKLSYDLALIYAKSQYEHALAHKTLPVALHHPQELEDSSFLTKKFIFMYLELLNSPDLFAEIQKWEPKLHG